MKARAKSDPVSIVRDIECPACDWPETIDYWDPGPPPKLLGSMCNKCGWNSAVSDDAARQQPKREKGR